MNVALFEPPMPTNVNHCRRQQSKKTNPGYPRCDRPLSITLIILHIKGVSILLGHFLRTW